MTAGDSILSVRDLRVEIFAQMAALAALSWLQQDHPGIRAHLIAAMTAVIVVTVGVSGERRLGEAVGLRQVEELGRREEIGPLRG